MRDTEKTQDQLIGELTALRRRVSELEAPGRGEEWFRRVVDTAYEGIWVLDAEWRTSYANRRMAEMLGYTVEEMLGRSALDFVYEADAGEAERRLAQRKRGVGEQSEFRLRRKDGSELRVLSCTNPILNESGETTGVLGMMTDITERKQAERQVRFQAQLLDTVGQAVVATDMRGAITYWNRCAEELYGWPAREVMGCLAEEILVAEDQEEPRDEILSRMKAGKGWSGEFTMRRRDGDSFPAHVTKTPVRDERGNLVGIIGVSMDITGRKQAEEELQKQAQTLREQARLLDLANDAIVCHDLNGGAITFWNRGAEAMYGWSREEAVGEDPRSLLKTQFPKPLEEIEKDLLREGRWEGELVNTRRDGTRVVTASRWALKRDEDAKPSTILEIDRDITENQRLKLREHEARRHLHATLRALRESETRLRRLAEVNVAGIVGADFSGNITEANEAFLQMVGYTREDLLWGDLHWDEIVPPEYLPLERQAMEQLERSGVCTPFEKELVRKDGSRIPVLIGAMLVRGSQDSAIAVVLDLTDGLDGDLREDARGDLVAAFEAMHVGQGELEDLSPDGDSGGRLLSRELSALRLADEELRDAVADLRAKRLNGGEVFVRTAQSLAQSRPFLQEVEYLLELNRRIAPRCEIRLSVEDGFPSELPALTRLGLLNILKEALVNSRRHSEARHIRVTLGLEGDKYCLEIADDGQGFETEEPRKGTGIDEMREGAHSLGGELEVESAPGRGTRVRVRAPL